MAVVKRFKAVSLSTGHVAEYSYWHSSLVIAPTGFGKTFSVFLGALINFINQHQDNYKNQKEKTSFNCFG